ncbi:endonuclease domain-containing 1 protein [Danio aesculapii]|uniref:endonuclease domain-containing 1 protein n=1 Tax=Danio aesculapii TaxID=1142201 RepID=UPI0024BF30C7|nr:endonuclease domain-containing 1 protein [Danio aesculapii]
MRLFVVPVLLVFGFPLIMTKIVDSFSKCSEFFVRSKPPVIPDILKDSVSKDNNRYKLICQDKVYFATLYDTTNKIPVFSAYKYIKTNVKTDRKKNFVIDTELKEDQAKDKDYKNQIKMSRGHLFPKSHAANQEAADSTFTLTNIVPQQEQFNNGEWNTKEDEFKSSMDRDCLNNNGIAEAFVVTGAIPSEKTLLNNKVNIPTHMWMAFCCFNKDTKKWMTKAYCATNEEKSTAVLPGETLAALQIFLNDKWKRNIKLFPDDCK